MASERLIAVAALLLVAGRAHAAQPDRSPRATATPLTVQELDRLRPLLDRSLGQPVASQAFRVAWPGWPELSIVPVVRLPDGDKDKHGSLAVSVIKGGRLVATLKAPDSFVLKELAAIAFEDANGDGQMDILALATYETPLGINRIPRVFEGHPGPSFELSRSLTSDAGKSPTETMAAVRANIKAGATKPAKAPPGTPFTFTMDGEMQGKKKCKGKAEVTEETESGDRCLRVADVDSTCKGKGDPDWLDMIDSSALLCLKDGTWAVRSEIRGLGRCEVVVEGWPSRVTSIEIDCELECRTHDCDGTVSYRFKRKGK